MTIPATTQSPGLDFAELHAHHSRADLRAFKKWARTTPEGSHGARDTARSIAVIAGLGITLLFVLLCTAVLVLVTIPKADNPLLWIILAFVLVFVALSVIRLTDILRRDVRFGPRWRRWMRLDRFAEANRMVYVREILSPHYEGSMFSIGRARRAYDVVATTEGRYIEIGNYQYRGETGIDRSLNRCGYVKIEADRRLPHIYLRSRAKRLPLSRNGATFARSQEFSLEGNFGDYFRLYAPGGYERDALYIFAPDLMAALIDYAAQYDIEFVDDYIYLYSHRRFNMRSDSTYRNFASLVDSVVNRALKQTRAYSDFRASGDFVTAQGSRLVPGITVAAVVGVLIIVGQILHLARVF
jgi:hypothetical protein